MSRISTPYDLIEDSLGLMRDLYSISAYRVYSRREGKFIPIGWTGTYRFSWKDAEEYEYCILDSELE